MENQSNQPPKKNDPFGQFRAKPIQQKQEADIQFPVRTSSSKMDDYLQEIQRNFEMGAVGASSTYASWMEVLETKPLNIPFLTCINGIPAIAIKLSKADIPDIRLLLRALQYKWYPDIFVKAYTHLTYPVVRMQLRYKDNPKDPLVMETMLTTNSGDVQDFYFGLMKEDTVDLVILLQQEKLAISCQVPVPVKDMFHREFKIAAEKHHGEMDPNEYNHTVTALQQEFPFAYSGTQTHEYLELPFLGRATNEVIKVSKDIAKRNQQD